MDEYRVRSLTPSEWSVPLDWAAAEGWNPGQNDASAFAAQDSSGFLVGERSGQPIATISAVRYGTEFGFIGFYIVQPSWRGQGFGWRVWQAGMARLAGRTIGLDGVVAQQDNYRRSGFVLAHRNIRFGGIGVSAPPDPTLTPLTSVPEIALLARVSQFEEVRIHKWWIFRGATDSRRPGSATQRSLVREVFGVDLRGWLLG